MKRFIALFLSLIFVLALAGCNNTKESETLTYSFRGEHEYFAVSNGSIILNDDEEAFNGGNLEITQSALFEDVKSFSTSFYTTINDERHIIMSNSVVDQTDGSVNVNGELGKIVGVDIISKEIESIDNLWFELRTTDVDGEENTYQIQLTLNKQ